MTLSLNDLMTLSETRMENMFRHYLKETETPAPLLQEAMRYAVLNGGKRVRPLLVYTAGAVVGANLEALDAPACAVELIHSYSLVHDDLPAMDNSDLRRGKPSCHKAHGEAMAILAGDALQAFVFQILACHPTDLSAEQRLQMIAVLSEASGPFGMAAGQALDMTILNDRIAQDKLCELYQLKTGALLSASVKLGILGAKQLDPIRQAALETYARHLGLAFQIQDDLLDIETETGILGKPQGLDAVNQKMTYPALLGMDAARREVKRLTDLALAAIEGIGAESVLLNELAGYLIHRKK